ncbi:MAG: histone deacetylase [Anaerolineaceae bacterium]|nr:MAG: histone deacetylase [Anaerolineaceae bacterium]
MPTAYLTHPDYIVHDVPGHPERPDRVRAVWAELKRANLLDKMSAITPQAVNDEQIGYAHTADYINLLHHADNHDYGIRFDADTLALPETPQIARLSAGGVLGAVEAVLSGAADNALAVTRPPGHHAIPARAMGFCFLGNVAIAARHAQRVHGLKRVLIVDYDVHHGNGTQDIFYDDDSVLFISTHQYPFYPGTGAINETGRGRGRGYTLNIPLQAGMGDAEHAAIYQQIVWPAARRFQPELIIVSAGFDGHHADFLAMMNMSLHGYAHLTRELIRMADVLCGGKIVFAMEGGYNTDVLAHGVRNIAHALLGEDEISDPFGVTGGREIDIAPLISRLMTLHGLSI